MVEERNGNYPTPPYWPERLTHNRGPRLSVEWIQNMFETAIVTHSYIMDGYPGPCAMIFDAGVFAEWHPAITVERAAKYADERL